MPGLREGISTERMEPNLLQPYLLAGSLQQADEPGEISREELPELRQACRERSAPCRRSTFLLRKMQEGILSQKDVPVKDDRGKNMPAMWEVVRSQQRPPKILQPRLLA